jgi:uncharacterized protein YdhG (YjbR/CyaY superfamily)
MTNKPIKKECATIDDYISRYPKHIQDILQKIRQTIKKAAPEAEETINYQIPTFKLNGNLVHFAAFKKHIGFYPNPSAIEAFQKELESFTIAKGSIRFPLDEPLPYRLVEKIVKFRVKEVKSKP